MIWIMSIINSIWIIWKYLNSDGLAVLWAFSFELKKMTNNILYITFSAISGMVSNFSIDPEVAHWCAALSISSVIVMFNNNVPEITSYIKSKINE